MERPGVLQGPGVALHAGGLSVERGRSRARATSVARAARARRLGLRANIAYTRVYGRTEGKGALNVVLFGIVVPVPSAVLYSNTILQDSRHEWVGVPIVVMTDWENEWS